MTLARGPQVFLGGAAQIAARGGAGRTMRENIAAALAIQAAGLVGAGTSVDGSSVTGLPPEDYLLAGPQAIIRVGSFAALRLINPLGLTSNHIATTDGYTQFGDGGGGAFDWVGSVAATAPAAMVTASSTTITGLPAGVPLFFGMGVAGLGIPSNATIASIVSPTSITISIAATISSPGGTSLTFNVPDDSCINAKPASLTVQQPGRWVRRLDSKIVTLEMAGGKGDYVFPAGGAGEVLGTDNATAFTRIAAGTASLAFSQGNQTQGITIKLGQKCYRASSITLSSGVKIEGVGAIVPNALVAGNTGPALFTAGSVLALEPTGAIVPVSGSQFCNLRIIRRGLDLNPTYAQIIAWNAAMAQELTFNKHWLPATAYTAGDVVMNLGYVFKCTTSGTSGTATTAGPKAMTTAADSIIDGTAKWQVLNQYAWCLGTSYTAGTICCNGNRIYQCDTSGTSSTNTNGPTAVTTGVNSITDGTVKWHYLGLFSTGIACASPYCVYEELVIVGFAKGMALTRAPNRVRNVFLDNLYCVDMRQAGDLVDFHRFHCVPIWSPTSGSIPDAVWRYKQGVGISAHDQVDGGHFNDCEVENWIIGLDLSNVWQVRVNDFLCETPGVYDGEACIRLRNIISYCRIDRAYTAGAIGFDIGCTNEANCLTPNPTGPTLSQLAISGCASGGDSTFSGTGGPSATRIFKISGSAQGTITDCHASQFSGKMFEFTAGDGGTVFWDIDARGDGVNASDLASFAIIDAAVAPFVHFRRLWSPNVNRWVVPGSYDDSIDLVAGPLNGGSHTVAPSVGWCMLTPAGTIAGYTVTMPAAPLNQHDLLISTTNTVTTLTLSPNSGQSISGAPTTIAANTGMRFRYLASTSTWYRVG